MDHTTALALKITAFLAVLAVVLLAAFALGHRGAARNGEQTITLAGQGKVTVVPDRATASLGVQVTKPDAKGAMAEADSLQGKVIAALLAAGVEKSDIRTSGLDLQPEYDYEGRGKPTITGYTVTQTVKVTMKDLKKAGDVLSAAAEAGGNATRINDFKLSVGDKDEAMGEARDKAIADARKKAQQFAKAADRELGKVIRITETGSDSGPQPYAQMYAEDSMVTANALKSAPIEPGEQKLSISVKVVWELR
ncbi:SIMPL domain-containing protein [Nocardioides cavernaquae]|uniref:DUF541 domain-containing protein n=1 Tax=Nocardioides cavernaquae TaxID=2321396 RepID=A0A3A5HH08_9ACTN|nr:SIMPL domain-containing protein [Nocardioides cavernaquae]RJS47364.1 DUF541 domain-containing protein [Nocardioides cavernaquae]